MTTKRKFVAAVGGLLALFGGTYGGLFAYKVYYDKVGEACIRELIPALEEVHARTGQFPESIKEYRHGGKMDHRVLGVFPPPAIRYRRTEAAYRIGFYEFPVGPFRWYDAGSREWFYEE